MGSDFTNVISPTWTPGATARCHSAGSSAAGPRASAVGRSTRANGPFRGAVWPQRRRGPGPVRREDPGYQSSPSSFATRPSRARRRSPRLPLQPDDSPAFDVRSHPCSHGSASVVKGAQYASGEDHRDENQGDGNDQVLRLATHSENPLNVGSDAVAPRIAYWR